MQLLNCISSVSATRSSPPREAPLEALRSAFSARDNSSNFCLANSLHSLSSAVIVYFFVRVYFYCYLPPSTIRLFYISMLFFISMCFLTSFYRSPSFLVNIVLFLSSLILYPLKMIVHHLFCSNEMSQHENGQIPLWIDLLSLHPHDNVRKGPNSLFTPFVSSSPSYHTV